MNDIPCLLYDSGAHLWVPMTYVRHIIGTVQILPAFRVIQETASARNNVERLCVQESGVDTHMLSPLLHDRFCAGMLHLRHRIQA